MKNMFEKRRIEVTELDLWQLRFNQVLSAVSAMFLRLVWTALGLVGLWYLFWERAGP